MWAVHSSAAVTELHSASTRHRATSFSLLNPYLAVWALFELSSLCKFLKLSIVLWQVVLGPVLRASHSMVELTSALQAVVLLADWTAIILQVIFRGEDCSAARSWTPTYFIAIPLCIQLKTEFLILGLQVAIDVVLNILHRHLFSTSRRTGNI